MLEQPSTSSNFDRRSLGSRGAVARARRFHAFARFAYALILPAMRADLDLTYSQAGSLNTANAVGYLVARSSARGSFAIGNRRLFGFGMVATVLSPSSARAFAAGFAEQARCVRSRE
jgi:hypothetical protein